MNSFYTNPFLNDLQVLICMTDGISHDSVVRPSRDLRNAGVRILALGIGRKFRRSQLYQMAGNSRYVFKAGFRSLSGVVRSIKRAACGGNQTVGRRKAQNNNIMEISVEKKRKQGGLKTSKIRLLTRYSYKRVQF